MGTAGSKSKKFAWLAAPPLPAAPGFARKPPLAPTPPRGLTNAAIKVTKHDISARDIATISPDYKDVS
jgi:hypothetical protein